MNYKILQWINPLRKKCSVIPCHVANNFTTNMTERPAKIGQQASLFPFIEHNGWRLFSFQSLKDPDPDTQFERMKAFNSRDDDIFLCTYPKSGTHWLFEIMSMLLEHSTEYNIREQSMKTHFEGQSDYSHLEAKTEQKRIIRSHLPFSFLPDKHIEKRAKIVHGCRNPKDRHVSQYLFLKGMRGAPPNWTWQEYFEDFVLNDNLMTGWFNYTREFLKATTDGHNIYTLYYENILLHPNDELSKLANYLEVEYDEQFIEDVVDKCSFHKLKEHKVDVSRMFHSEGKSTLFRKGIIGDWKNWFTVAQNEQFDALYKQKMEGFNVNFVYENH